MPEKVSPLDYAFAIGKVRTLEKYLLKEDVFREAADADLKGALRLFVEAGSYPEELEKVTRSDELEVVLSQELSSLLKLTKSLLKQDKLGGLLRLDSCREAEKLRSQVRGVFLKDYLAHVIDLYNIKTFLRLKVLGEPVTKAEERFSCEGFIKKPELLKLYPGELNEFIHALGRVKRRDSEFIDYASELKEGILRAEEKKSFAAFEKASGDFLIRFIRKAKFFTFGPEPLLAYYFAKANEINLIRLVVLAKLNDLSSGIVKERLNISYA
jgi:vacuolar-type H+-ATPase subunit C/Vma6